MVNVTISDNVIQSKGHAESRKGDETYDLVCAAVSAIMITWVNGLDAMGVKAKKVHAEKGLIFVELADNQDSNLSSKYVSVLRNGIQAIADAYPENVTLT